MTAVAECNIGGEDARLAALHRYDVLDSQPEEAFDRITRLVKVVLEMPMVVVSLVDRDRQWFKSKQGVKAAETPRSISFCTHTIQGTKPLIVNDAHTDPRFANSPLVVGDPHIRFYVGVPLRSRDGYNVGALCSMDTKARDLSRRADHRARGHRPAGRRRIRTARSSVHRCPDRRDEPARVQRARRPRGRACEALRLAVELRPDRRGLLQGDQRHATGTASATSR